MNVDCTTYLSDKNSVDSNYKFVIFLKKKNIFHKSQQKIYNFYLQLISNNNKFVIF